MEINKEGLEIIKSFEGLRLHAYVDPATGGEPITIGYGHTGKEVKLGQHISLERANLLLVEDVKKFEKGINNLIKVEITLNQFSSMVSLAYNIGIGNFSRSTLLTLLNRRDYKGASAEFLKWNKAAGKVMAGLSRRRAAEKNLFDKS